MRFLLIAFTLLLHQTPAFANDLIIDPEPDQNAPNVTEPLEEENLIDNKIYFFVHSMCQNCKPAFEYIMTKHPELNLPLVDMKYHHNFDLYRQCVTKFKINNSELHLPLICMGDKFIMGWDEQTSGAMFDRYLAEFQADNAQ